MPRTRMNPEKLRETAIDTTLVQMRRFGFERVRLTDVAKELGVSHATLYLHFTDKAALLDAVTERWLSKTREVLRAIVPRPERPLEDVEEWFVTLYRLKRQQILQEPELYRAFDAATALRKPLVILHLEELRQQLQGLLRRAAPGIDEVALGLHARLLYDATSAFHHPKLMAEYVDEDREALLKRVVAAMLAAFNTSL